ncbi:nitrous oxide reductase family maturation protein NosD [Parapedobacter sp. 10938]|uniref:nitrous oxide reductase family maturation protein NosD n=1 Tax=Parapedobacter flavus TaxID=3110225 RepID=UPI002DB8C670|nr:nitrous oxide reductase family maturation protein NosD [Parapedobacter sp. 10938]MEC3879484.1 nitrous oxide reductase family maturation protein NosD [Parapedobacter sp. 10938]
MLRPIYRVFSACVCLMVGGVGYAATIQVGPSHPITSIKQALAQAAAGDTIRVHGGIYREGNIEIRKAVALIGVGNPIIDGEKEHEPFSIFAPYVTISGFTVKASGQSSIRDIAAIKVYDTHHITIADNTLDDNFFGIYLQASQQCTVRNNRLTAYGETEQLTGNGIHSWKSDSLQIVGNTIVGHRDGIYLEFVTHTEVRDNVASDNRRYGLHFMFSHENGYYGNTFSRNGAGVAVMYTKRVRMENNVFSENWGDAAYGLLLKDITDSHIEHNVFSRNTTGILMEGSNRVQIQRNQFEANGWAMKMQSSCMDNMLTQNNFVQNTFDLATNGSLKLNTFVRNYWDKYEGYDLNKDKEGDVPYRPVSLFSMVVEKYPAAMLLFRSFMVTLLDRTERVMPSLIPEDLKDDFPMMNPVAL